MQSLGILEKEGGDEQSRGILQAEAGQMAQGLSTKESYEGKSPSKMANKYLVAEPFAKLYDKVMDFGEKLKYHKTDKSEAERGLEECLREF